MYIIGILALYHDGGRKPKSKLWKTVLTIYIARKNNLCLSCQFYQNFGNLLKKGKNIG